MKESKEIRVCLHPEGGHTQVSEMTAVVGDRVGRMPAPTRRGYVFDGWYTTPSGDGVRVTAETCAERDSDTWNLYARWTKETATAKQAKSTKGGQDPLRRQKAAIAWMCVAVLLLTTSFFVVQHIVSIYHYEDADGTTYRIQKKDGKYALCDADGSLCEQNSDGYYLTALGTQLSVDVDSGEYRVYAHVDVEGSEQVGYGQNVMMFRQLTYDMSSTKDYGRVIRSIEVTNEFGSYRFYRRMKNEDPKDASEEILSSDDPADYVNEFGIDGYRTTQYDETMFAALAVGCGYTLAVERLESPARLSNGGIDWSEYGLAEETRTRDEDGTSVSYAYKPATYTITTMTGETHTVHLGDLTVTEDGYYARYEGRDRVYVLSAAGLQETAMKPLEAMITPQLVYPMSLSTYFDVENFKLYTGDRLISHVTYIPLEERENKLFSIHPYQVATEYMEGYLPNADNIGAMLQFMYAMSFNETVKLGPDEADLAKYGLDAPAHRILFTYHIPSSEGGGNADNEVWISEKTEEGTYYAYAPEYDMIVSFDESQATYLEWEADRWYEREYFQFNIAHVLQMKVESPTYSVTFDLDNSRSNQSNGMNSENLVVYANGKLLNYRVVTTKTDGSTSTMSATDNFRGFYLSLMRASVEGMADLTEAEMEDFRRLPDSDCQLKMTISLDDGQGQTQDMVIRFYQYSERRSYMTIEVLDGPDGVSDGTRAQGQFCVLRSFCDKLIADARRAAEGIEVISTSKS